MTEEDDPSKVAFTFTTRMTLQDWRAFEYAALRRWDEESTKSRAVRFGLIVALGFVAAWLSDWLQAPLQLLGVFLGAGLAGLALWLTTREARKRYLPEHDGAFLGEHVYELDADGIRTHREGANSFASWSVVKSVSITAEHLFLWLDKVQAFVVPLRVLPAGVGRDEFVQQVEAWSGRTVVRDSQWRAASRGGTVHDADVAGATAEPAAGRRSRGWTVALLRLLALRPTDAPGKASVGLIALLACLACGVWIGVDWLRNQPDPEFFAYGAPSIAWYALVTLAIAAVLARFAEPSLEWPRVLAVVLAAIPVLVVASYLIDQFLSPPWITVASVGVFLYLVGYAARALVALSGARQPRALASGLVVAMFLLWVTEGLYVHASVWLPGDDGEETSYERTRKEAEPLLFAQSARIDAAIDAIDRSSTPSPAAFFVGFAGYAEERVFAEEIKLAARVIGERYGSEKRSLLLINDQRSLDAYSLASPTALRHALRALAAKMDTDRDVLFLALSSHGDVDTLSVSNGALMLQDLTATDLAAALQDSGIKWRVIVISACHSGSFIDELSNAKTMVITASAPDKTSFGCSDDRDLTYFGEAFYRDALPGAKSLREAFDTARADIVAREKREDIEASEPQAFFGEEIERHLATLP